MEVVLSAALLVLSSPVLLLSALAVFCTDCGPVLFRQTRAGQFGRPFELLKFRSMRVNDRPIDHPGEITENDPLVTTVGRLMRRFKVDELPQLMNVLRGDMSWIGPRPTVVAQVEKYTPFQRRRLEVLPGMTGWAQVNGGAEISWAERIILDAWYVEHRSFFLDMKILWRTIDVIVRGHRPDLPAMQEAIHFAKENADLVELRLPRLAHAPGWDEEGAQALKAGVGE